MGTFDPKGEAEGGICPGKTGADGLDCGIGINVEPQPPQKADASGLLAPHLVHIIIGLRTFLKSVCFNVAQGVAFPIEQRRTWKEKNASYTILNDIRAKTT